MVAQHPVHPAPTAAPDDAGDDPMSMDGDDRESRASSDGLHGNQSTIAPEDRTPLLEGREESLTAVPCSTHSKQVSRAPLQQVERAEGDTAVPLGRSESDPGRTPRFGAKYVGNQLYVAFVILFFAGSSLGAIFINKTCLTGYHFRYPLTLMLGQMTFAIWVLSILHATGYNRIPPLRKRDMSLMALPTVLFTSNVVVGLSALSLVNIPMFSAFRRLTLLFVMGAEYVFLKKTHPTAIVNAVVVMTFGAFISAIDDVTFSRLGYFLVFLNNMLTALYLASIKKVMKDTEFQPLSLLYYTALMGFPLVSTLLLLTGELSHVITAFKTQPELMTFPFWISLVLTASGAFAVNFSTSLCTHVTSPLTTSVAGQVKNVLQTVLGFFSWGFVPTRMNMAGLLVALAAQLVFAYLKFKENAATESKKPPPQATDIQTGYEPVSRNASPSENVGDYTNDHEPCSGPKR